MRRSGAAMALVGVFAATGCTQPDASHVFATRPCRTDGTEGACCTADRDCDAPLACHMGQAGGTGRCAAPCTGASCALPGAPVGGACDTTADCRAGLACVDVPGGATCTARCDHGVSCPPSDDVGPRVCVALSAGAGQWCLAPCTQAPDCTAPLECVPVGHSGIDVCFPPFD